MKRIKHGLFLACFLLLSGCASIDVHQKDWGHPYAGTEQAINWIEPGFYVSAMMLFIPFPFILADVPCSFAVDTVLLPADLVMTPKKSRHDVTYVPAH
jgi:uncharacterized protein YceK